MQTTTRMEKKVDIVIYIPDSEAQKWLLFQQYYEPFNIMVERGVFAIKNGGVSMHFDAHGTLQTIQRADFLYSRKKDLSTMS